MDAIPILSQLKSLVQVICKQKEAARQTQINFSKRCPVVSQLRSAVKFFRGNKKDAHETQIEFIKFLAGVVNGLPIIGHLKGIVHYAIGDKENGDLAMKSASHTSAVIGGGIAGMVVGGPVGSVAMGIGAGAVMDGTVTAIDSAVKKEFSPFGALEVVKDPTNAGKWCDAVGGVILDGALGRAAGGLVRAAAPAAAGAAAAADDTAAALRNSGINAAQFASSKASVSAVIKLCKNAVKLYNENKVPIANIKKELNALYSECEQKVTIENKANPNEELSVQLTSHDKLSVKIVHGVKNVYLNDKVLCFFISEDLYRIVNGELHKLDRELRFVVMNDGKINEIEDTSKVDTEIISQQADIDAQSCGSSVYHETTEDMDLDFEKEDSYREEEENLYSTMNDRKCLIKK